MLAGMLPRAIKLRRTLSALIRYRGIRKDPLAYVDIGARGGLPGAWEVAQRLGFIRPTFFEPDKRAASELVEKYPRSRVLLTALGSVTGLEVILHITREPGRTSILVPDPRELYVASDLSSWEVVSTEPVILSRLDSVWKEDWGDPSFVKADVQGYELEILKGMGRLLDRVLCLELEVSLVPCYVGQPLLIEVHRFLRENEFDLARLKPNGLVRGTDIVELNAFFVRRGKHDLPAVRMWKAFNDVGDHHRAITWGY